MPSYLYEDGTIISFARSPGSSPRGGRALGLRKKTFELKGKHKRFIRSSAIRLFLKKKHGVLFCTLTFPQDIEGKEANRCFSNFTDNLKTNFKLNDYVAVKELTKKGRPHFHCLFDIPFTDFKILNKAWCSTFNSFMPFSHNAFTTGRNPIIRHINTVVSYITKYLTKVQASELHTKPDTRQYFVSKGTHCKPGIIPEWLVHYLKYHHGFDEYEGDCFTWRRLYNWAEIPEDYIKKIEPPPIKRPKKQKKKPLTDAFQQELLKNIGLKFDLHYKLS